MQTGIRPFLLIPLAFTILAALLTGCALSPIEINSTYDPSVQFANLRSYAFLKTPPKASMERKLRFKIIKDSIRKQLNGLGMVESKKQPDFIIALHGSKKKKVNVQRHGYAYREDSRYRNHYPYKPYRHDPYRSRVEYSTHISTYEYEIGTLIIDFITAGKKELIWRGTASGVVTPNTAHEEIQKAVYQVLQQFPPKPK